jgi:glycerophosphoryl diester phosphodiesterase
VHHDAIYPDGRPVSAVAAADRPQPVPTLAEALAACTGMGVNVELKCGSETGELAEPDTTIADVLVAELEHRATAAITTPPILVSSFTGAALARVRELDPRIDTALLTYTLEDPAATVAGAVAAGHRALHPFDATVDEDLVARAHHVGLEVNVWTVDDPARMVELASFGADGICTNVPDVAVRALGRWNRSRRG